VKAALEGLPNGVIEADSVSVAATADGTTNYVYDIEFTKNPGSLKDISVDTSAVTCQSSGVMSPAIGYKTMGEDADRFNVHAGDIAQSQQGSVYVYTKFDPSLSSSSAIQAGSMIKIEDDIYVIGAVASDSSCQGCRGMLTLTSEFLGSSVIASTSEGSHTVGANGANVLGTTRIYSTCDVSGGASTCDNATRMLTHGSATISTTIDGLAAPNARSVVFSAVGTLAAGSDAYFGDCHIQFEKTPVAGVWTPIAGDHGCTPTDKTQTYEVSTIPFCYEAGQFPYGTFTEYTGSSEAESHTLTMASDDATLFPTGVQVTVNLFGIASGDQHPFKDTDVKPQSCGSDYNYGSDDATTLIGTFSYASGIYTFTILGNSQGTTTQINSNCLTGGEVQLALGPDTYLCGTSVGTTAVHTYDNKITATHSDYGALFAGDEVLVCTQDYGCELNTVGSRVDGSGLPTLLLNKFYARGNIDRSSLAALIYRIDRAAGKDSSVYVSECSGRGLCNDRDGTCTCFKGYGGDDCSTQDALCA
jgi:hypothetical protein